MGRKKAGTPTTFVRLRVHIVQGGKEEYVDEVYVPVRPVSCDGEAEEVLRTVREGLAILSDQAANIGPEEI
jgi:hypothetical protein